MLVENISKLAISMFSLVLGQLLDIEFSAQNHIRIPDR